MAAILNERWHWSSTGTFLQSPPLTHKNIGPVDSGVRQTIDGSQIKMAAMAAILNELRHWSSRGNFEENTTQTRDIMSKLPSFHLDKFQLSMFT
jgi:hypothetical protein